MVFLKPMMNETRNQHYLSQAEQRLNAASPNANRSNLRIYSFKVEDRDRYQIALESTKGRVIHSNLSMLDLFTFDTTEDKRLRHNLEGFFQRYEGNVAAHTVSLLDKLKVRSNDITVEVVELFAAKLLNFIRNPFCVEKVLNTFPGVGSFHPTDPILLASFYRIIAGVKPQQAYLCRELGISDQRYNEWLRVIFLLLMPVKEGQLTLYEGIVKALLEDKSRYWGVFVFDYDDRPCLLSDRGYSQLLPDTDDSLSFSFNLCSTAFVQYCCANPRKLLEGRAHSEFLDYALANREKLSLSTIQVTHLHNHMPMLAQYNRRVIEQCHSRVYCSKKDGIVVAG